MKFVCDNCQAKYQIGDDKVAGKTVRMKCRKCGYNIKVSALTSTGGLDAALADPPSHEAPAPSAVPAPPVSALQAITPGHAAAAPRPTHATSQPHPAQPAPRAAPSGLPHPERAPWSGVEDESTAIMSAPVRDAVAAVLGDARDRPAPAQGHPATVARPIAAPAPRSVTAGVHPPRPVTSGAPRPQAAQPRPVTRQSSSSMAAVQQEHAQPAAPRAAPQVAAQPAPDLEPEWYVGIGGSPIGPVHVAVIRERAAAREVDGESLVWREGLSEWLPLRTFPELLKVVTSAVAPAPAPTPTPFAAMAALSAPAGVRAPTGAPVTPAPVAAAPAPVAAAPAPVAAAPAPAAVAPVQRHGDPFAPAPSASTPTPPVTSTPTPPTPAQPLTFTPPPPTSQAHPAPLAALAPNGAPKANGFHHGVDAAIPADAPSAASLVAAPAPPTRQLDTVKLPETPKPPVDIDPALEEALIPRRGNTHPMAYAFIAAAAVFGGVAAYVLLSKPPPPPAIVVVQAPAPTTGPSGSPTVVADDKGSVEVGDPSTAPGSTVRPGLGKPWPKTSATTHEVAPLDTSGFVPNVPGPVATAPTPPTGGQLSQGEMNGVVAQNQPRIRRRCWEPALAGQTANGPKNARVMVAISIAASGNVDSASASGSERDFPGLASCIGGMVKGWKFPASGGSSSVNVPFTFVGQ